MTDRELQDRVFDNLFNAEHRQIMIDRYGYTEAQTITIEELLLTL